MLVGRYWIWAAASAAAMISAQERRLPRIDVEHYVVEGEINPGTQSLKANVSVRFVPLEENTTTVAFELNNALSLSRVADLEGRQIPASRSHSDFTVRVIFPEPLAKGKPATLLFSYEGRLQGNEESPVQGIRFAAIKPHYSFLMYPARWFPVNEYTADRFTAELKITVPSGFRVIASGLESKDAASDGRMTWLFSFNQASFPGTLAVVEGEPARISSAGVTTFLYFRGESREMAAAYGEETGKVMVHSTGLFGLAPQANLTVVETEDGAPNGYSAPGLILLSSKAIGKQVNSRLLVNQIARQWWGNLTAPASRNHLWIMNGMARYAELMWVEATAGPGTLEAEMRDTDVEALTIDNPPVIQTVRLEDYSPEYWAVTGAKGAAVLHMLRAITGEEPFRKMLKEIPEQFAWKAVNTDDFRKAAEAAAGRDLRFFFIQWIESSGAPEFKLEYTVFRTAKGFRVMGKISQDLDTFRMPLEMKIETEGNPEFKQTEVVGTSSEFIVETFGKPKSVLLDPNNRVLRFSNPMRIAVAIRRGEMFAEISEFIEALKEYQKALDVNRNSSLAHYRVAEVFFLQRNYQSAANEFRESLNGDLEPKWIEVWAHLNLGKIFDITGQRDRATNEYNLAIRTKDNTQGAQEEAAKYLKQPYERAAVQN